MKTITIREAYDWLQLGTDINQIEWDELLHFLQKEYAEMIEIGARKLRFINLVGVIQLSSVRIEILPKLAIDKDTVQKNREALLNMLVVTKTFPVQIHESTYSQLVTVDLLQIFAEMYTERLLKELKRGVHKEYSLREENSRSLKGKLLVAQHIRHNGLLPIRAYCEYDTFHEDIALNRILKKAFMVIFPYLTKRSVRSHALFILDLLEHVKENEFRKHDLNAVTFNRQNRRFEHLFHIAKMILSHEMMTSRFHPQSSFSFLFEMNVLFEAYIEKCLSDLTWNNSMKLFSQHDRHYLLVHVHTGRGNIKLKPDFYLVSDTFAMIIDTKWKNIAHEGRILYNQADIYQMYAYVTSYQHVNKGVLLYPRTEDGQLPLWKVPEKEKYIAIHTVRLTSFTDSLNDLKEIITGKSRSDERQKL